ncbi:hypothetical protein BJX76DRAFT_356070 [Aspergillus varians]
MKLSAIWSAWAVAAAAQHAVADDSVNEGAVPTVFTSYILTPILITSFITATEQSNPEIPSSGADEPDSPSTSVGDSPNPDTSALLVPTAVGSPVSPPEPTPPTEELPEAIQPFPTVPGPPDSAITPAVTTTEAVAASPAGPPNVVNPPSDDDNDDDNNDENDDDNNDNDPSTSDSETSTTISSSSSCTSGTTAYQVTVLCEPTSITSGDSTITTTTCSPSTTITTTGCTVTEITTIITGTPTPRGLCSPDTCGDSACPILNGGGAVVSSVNCANVPTITVDTIPTRSSGSGPATDLSVIRRDNSLRKRVDYPMPLPDVAPQDIEQYLTQINIELLRSQGWAPQDPGLNGLWNPFPREIKNYGMNGLHGCTALIIITSKGLYISHIFENGIFSTYDANRNPILTDVEVFRLKSTEALIWGGDEYDNLQDLRGLRGTDENPGPLHRSSSPQIIVVTPFAHGNGGELLYGLRADWIGGEVARCLYESEANFPADDPKPWIVIGYEVRAPENSFQENNNVGKWILEVTPLQFYQQLQQPGGQPLSLEVGRWRLWVGGKYILEWDFWNLPASLGGQGQGHQRPQRPRDAGAENQSICPITPTPIPTTFSTTIKATIAGTNPPGQPPGFDLPTAEPTATSTRTNPAGFDLPTTIGTATKSTTRPANPSATEGKTLPKDPDNVGDQTCIEQDGWKPAEKNQMLIQQMANQCLHGGIDEAEMSFGPDTPVIEFQMANGYGYPFYVGQIGWWKGCVGPRQNPIFPMEGYDCRTLLKENFEMKNCRHFGYGGYRQVGCLYYFSQLYGGASQVPFVN